MAAIGVSPWWRLSKEADSGLSANGAAQDSPGWSKA